MNPQLTILGLGPGNPKHRTIETVEILAAAESILFRTLIHPGLESFAGDPRVSSCDDLYEFGETFDEVYSSIVERVLSKAQLSPIVYAVPGHPLVGERTVAAILDQARELKINSRVVSGISAIDVVATTLAVDPMASEAQIIDATELQRFVESGPFNGALPDISPLHPVLLCQVYSSAIASAAKLALCRIFPDEHFVRIVTAAGIDTEVSVVECQLFELDRAAVNHLTSVWIDPMAKLESTRWPLTLQHIVARLRAPDGCPWDREQTYETLRSTAIEEAYEVAEAIDSGDLDNLAEELGDLLLHVAMQAQIAEEAGDFSIGDVYDHVNRKLVRRHPHVFGSVIAETPDKVIETWESVKASERVARGQSPVATADPYDRLPKAMPVLHRVTKIARKRQTEPIAADGDKLGDALLALVENVVRAGLDPEIELERAYRRNAARSAQE